MFLAFFHIFSPHNTTQHTHHTHAFLSVSSGFSVFPHAHSTQHTHSQTHTRTPATDRDHESGLSKSHTRKNHGKCLKKAMSGETLARARADADGQIVRLRRSDDRQSNHLVAGSLPIFPRFQGKKRMI